ncbi:hypothetical protein BDW74DRAFT_119125 [Aspergillus multicolor]|uniref:uncharacterized protein n=1 Tax=Aspergillus multicolor TaxID=41759 RepID=UPI003CCDED67
MASTRLRRTFRYPDDSGDDDDREELDEEEQESVIRLLKRQNEERDSYYSLIFAALPLLSTIVFIPSLLSSRASGLLAPLLSLLGILSLAATAYTISSVPPRRPDPKGKRPMRSPDLRQYARRYLLPGNTGICVLLGMAYLFPPVTSTEIHPVIYLVPAALLITILFVRQVMASVDIKPLEDLRYEYKGA